MDAEKFDKVVMDLLYDELDELTRASAIRHTEQSGRAKALYSELRATREVGALPLVEPPPDLTARILAAEERAHAERPLGQRLGALVSIAASYAMRPQMAMAALLLLMVGSSLVLVRVKPGPTSSVQVTERGVPESDREPAAAPAAKSEAVAQAEAPLPDEAAPAARAKGAASRAEPAPADKVAEAKERPSSSSATSGALARDDHRERKDVLYGLADDGPSAPGAGAGFAPPPAAAKPSQPVAGLDIQALPAEAPAAAPAPAAVANDCASAVAHYESVIAGNPSPPVANAARYAAADCYVRLGRVSSARRQYTALLSAPDYADRARKALASLPAAPAATESAPAKAAAPAGSSH